MPISEYARKAYNNAKSAKYKASHRAEIAKRAREIYSGLTDEGRKALIENRREYQARYNQQNKERLAAFRREHYDRDDNHARYRKRYEQKRHEYIACAEDRQRNLRERGSHTQEDIDRLYASQCGVCTGCGLQLENSRDRRVKNHYEVDHVMPVALGGSNTADNLQLLCCPCNRRKHAMHPDEWAARIQKLSA